MDIEQTRADFITQLRNMGSPERAAYEQKYLKSALHFYGVNVWGVTALVKDWLKPNRDLPMDDIAALAARMWASDWHEERTVALQLLSQRTKQLSRTHLPLIEQMLHEAEGWAHLDVLATDILSGWIKHDPTLLEYLPRWAEDANFWVRRAAILAQMQQFRRGEGDFELFERITVPQLREGEDWSKEERFFIRKAIGWALRECTRYKPEWIVGFVNRHRAEMSSLSLREATRKLPPEWAAQIESA